MRYELPDLQSTVAELFALRLAEVEAKSSPVEETVSTPSSTDTKYASINV
jgi:hypothetical protein